MMFHSTTLIASISTILLLSTQASAQSAAATTAAVSASTSFKDLCAADTSVMSAMVSSAAVIQSSSMKCAGTHYNDAVYHSCNCDYEKASSSLIITMCWPAWINRAKTAGDEFSAVQSACSKATAATGTGSAAAGVTGVGATSKSSQNLGSSLGRRGSFVEGSAFGYVFGTFAVAVGAAAVLL